MLTALRTPTCGGLTVVQVLQQAATRAQEAHTRSPPVDISRFLHPVEVWEMKHVRRLCNLCALTVRLPRLHGACTLCSRRLNHVSTSQPLQDEHEVLARFYCLVVPSQAGPRGLPSPVFAFMPLSPAVAWFCIEAPAACLKQLACLSAARQLPLLGKGQVVQRSRGHGCRSPLPRSSWHPSIPSCVDPALAAYSTHCPWFSLGIIHPRSARSKCIQIH